MLNRRVRLAVATILFAIGVIGARLLPAHWNCPPMGFCPLLSHDLNDPYRVLAVVAGAVAAAVVLLPFARRRSA